MRFAVDKVRESGCDEVMVTDRGTTFGYGDLVVDFRGIPEMQAECKAPVIMDVTHSLQQPNTTGGVTGGRPDMIETIARAAIAVGADGLLSKLIPNRQGQERRSQYAASRPAPCPAETSHRASRHNQPLLNDFFTVCI